MDPDSAQLRAFLADSLALWRVEGAVEVGEAPVVAAIRAADGTLVCIERISADSMPFRWMVRRRIPGETRDERARPCGSLVGVLNAIRAALGVDRGTPVRIAPAPPGA